MKKTLWCAMSAKIAFFIIATGLAARTPPATAAADHASPPSAADLGKVKTIPDYHSGCTQVLTSPSVVYPGDVISITARAAYGGVCGGSTYVWMSYAVRADLDGEEAGWTSGGSIYDFCYWGDPQPVVPGGVSVELPDGNTHTITFYISEDLIYNEVPTEIDNGAQCYSNPGNYKNVVGPAVVMSGNGGTHGWSSVVFFSIQVDEDIEVTLNKSTFSTSDHITIKANVQPLASACYPFVRVVTPGNQTYYLTMNEGVSEIPTPYLGTESGAITLPSAITDATILDLSFAGLSLGTYYVESGTISPTTTDLNDLKYINGVDRKSFVVQ